MEKESEIVWQNHFYPLGTSSSLRCVDLNQDDILDVILGAGKNEFQASDSAVLALNGATGELLWSASAKDQIVGTPVFLKINEDEIPDLIIGGRSAQLMAINGQTGDVLWRFKILGDSMNTKGYLRFNFYSPQVLPDQDQDGIEDILISNGGNVRAFSDSGEDRYPGVLAILSGANGELIVADTMPDGRETYCSPVLYDFDGDGVPSIVYGTGGETFGGHLYLASLQDLLDTNLKKSKVLLSKENNGFIAPPTLTDITGDGVADIIANWHGGAVIMIDGQTLKELWQVQLPSTELYNAATPGEITGDGIPDFFVAFSQGKWPKNTGSIPVLLDGKTGEILFRDTIGCAGYATALSYDFNQDGKSDFLWNTNEYNCTGIFLAKVEYRMLLLDGASQNISEWIPLTKAKNVSTTPWLGDLDADGFLDLVYCIQANTDKMHTYAGIRLERRRLNIPTFTGKSWTEYMGPNGKGLY